MGFRRFLKQTPIEPIRFTKFVVSRDSLRTIPSRLHNQNEGTFQSELLFQSITTKIKRNYNPRILHTPIKWTILFGIGICISYYLILPAEFKWSLQGKLDNICRNINDSLWKFPLTNVWIIWKRHLSDIKKNYWLLKLPSFQTNENFSRQKKREFKCAKNESYSFLKQSLLIVY